MSTGLFNAVRGLFRKKQFAREVCLKRSACAQFCNQQAGGVCEKMKHTTESEIRAYKVMLIRG